MTAMKLGTLLTIKRVSAVLAIGPGLLLLIIGLRLTGLTIQYDWDTALNTLKLGGVNYPHHVRNEAGELIIDPEVEREAEEGFTISISILAALTIGSFFCFRWAKAEIARNRGSPPTKD